MERKEGLKPCPFCGRTNQRFLMDMDIYEYPHNRGKRAIICDCGLRLYARDHKEAEEKWQNRLYDEFIKDLIEKNERLRAIPEQLHKEMSERMIEERKIERKLAVREMQERLNKHFCHDPAFLGVEQRLIMDVIDQIAGEMLEGKNV